MGSRNTLAPYPTLFSVGAVWLILGLSPLPAPKSKISPGLELSLQRIPPSADGDLELRSHYKALYLLPQF